MDLTSAELLEQFENGDQRAADELFARYVERLTRLARTRLSPKLSSRIDPEDVVHSAYRSFFVAAGQGRFSLERSGDLWRLLVRITLHKLYRSAAHHTAEMRSVDREQSPGDANAIDTHFTAHEPTPDEAVALADEMEWLFAELPPLGRRVLELRLQGETLAEIAAEIEHSERTVRRMLTQARDRMTQRQREFDDETAEPLPRRLRTVDHELQMAPLSNEPAQKPLRGENAKPCGDVDAPLLYGDYLLQQLLGSGGVGKVYRAVHQPTAATVAVKYLKKQFVQSPPIVERFIEEARIVAGLQHAGIVATQGLGRTPHGGFFIAMDLVDGPNLETVTSAARPQPSDATRWIAQAALAIDHAHQHGVIHCDLKPSNLLLAPDGCIRVVDFGFARTLHTDAANLRGMAGTAAYMAPEQIDSYWGNISPRTDVYGLGAVLFHLLTGAPPASGKRVADILAQIVRTRPHELSDRFPIAVDAALRAICLRCLQKSPADRYASAAALSRALQDLGHSD